jgi:hypothetical protein
VERPVGGGRDSPPVAAYRLLVPEPAADLLTDHGVRAAIAASHLRDLPPDVVASLLTAARWCIVPAGHTLHRVGEASGTSSWS